VAVGGTVHPSLNFAVVSVSVKHEHQWGLLRHAVGQIHGEVALMALYSDGIFHYFLGLHEKTSSPENKEKGDDALRFHSKCADLYYKIPCTRGARDLDMRMGFTLH
jgi:hypothetical protein